MPNNEPTNDLWSEWILRYRHADDDAYQRVIREGIEKIANRVLDGARLGPDMSFADIGCGDGLLAFLAINRYGPSLRVTLTDISWPLVRHVEQSAMERGVRNQCEFLQGSADKLEGIASGTLDAAGMRAVLAYVADKPSAFRELHRVLKPGGRISLAEPILQDESLELIALKRTLEAQPQEQRNPFMELVHKWKSSQFPDTEGGLVQNPLTNFTERDLVRMAYGTGFVDIHLEFHVNIVPSIVKKWDIFLGSSPHPLAPTIGTVLEERFSPSERELFEQIMRPAIEERPSINTERVAYLTATKPMV